MDKRGRILVICATILVLIFVGTASARTWNVDDDGGADFSVIQEAINNASMGDTILVHSGVYYENVYVNKSVTLKGIGYPVVAANGSGSAITLNADGITLEGFNATNSGSLWDGAGINVISGNNTITGNNVRNNSDGISVDSASNNSITGNNVYNNEYGGIYLADSSNNNSITGNTFVNNGLRISNSYQNTVEGNIVNGKLLVYLEDASDYTVKDAGQVILVNCTNITVENLDLSNTDVGIELWKTENSRISNNNVRNNNCGSISLSDSSNNSITGNNASNNNGDGISISDSSNNTITDNNASSNSNVGIYLSGDSSNNTITGNNVRNNSNVGIWLSSFVLFPVNNTITGNNVHNNYGGIYLSRSSNNSITGNNVGDNNDDGISLSRSSNNSITSNTFVNDGLSVDDSYQNTVEENKVNGKPLVYLVDASDYTVRDAGQVILVNCTNITIEGLDLANTSVGIELWKTEDSKVLNNTVSDNSNTGIILSSSSNNTITGNNVRNNSNGDIDLSFSSNNSIYLNNFINNTDSVDSYASTNIWNSPEEITYTYVGTTYASYLGNYWADYKGRADANGIGNTPYSIDSEKEECDLYPLMTPFENYISSESETEVAATANMETIAKTFVTLLTESEFEKAHALFNKDMAEAVPVNKLNATWNGLIDQYGAFTGIENIRSAKEKGYETVFVTCNFSKTFLDAKIVFDIHEKIAGLFFLPIYGPPEYVNPDSFTESECTVGTGKWKLPGTLTIPKGEGPFYAVVLVAGSGPEDMNETIGPNEPFKDLAWGLATEGIAVLRYDKRTYRHPEECIAMIKNDNFTVNDETIDDAIAAVDLLRETERIDPDNIFVLGHSLGGYLAPRIAARNENISGVILLAAPARSLPDLIIEQTEYFASLDGTTDDKEAKSLEEVKEQATKVKELNISKGEILFGAPESYWADLSDYDPVNVARNLSRPILILQGERDYHVTMVDYEMWIKGLPGKNNVCFKNILYSDFNHLFMTVPGTGKATPADLFRPGHVALIVIDNVADWIIYESKRK